MSQNLIAHVCVAGVALLLDGVRVNFKPGETLPNALPLTVLDELVSLGAVEKRIAEPTSFVSEAAGSNEAGAAGGAIPGHPYLRRRRLGGRGRACRGPCDGRRGGTRRARCRQEEDLTATI